MTYGNSGKAEWILGCVARMRKKHGKDNQQLQRVGGKLTCDMQELAMQAARARICLTRRIAQHALGPARPRKHLWQATERTGDGGGAAKEEWEKAGERHCV